MLAFAPCLPLSLARLTAQTPLCRHPRALLSMRLGRVSATDKLITLAVNRGVAREIAERVVTRATAAAREWEVCVSDFVTPPERDALELTLEGLEGVTVCSWGGYDSAERCVVAAVRKDLVEGPEDVVALLGDKLALLNVTGAFKGQGHRDFMGAVLGAGVTRAKVGDVVVLEDGRGAMVVVTADIADFLVGGITSVGPVDVAVERLPLKDIEIQPKRVKAMQSVEASMRLDAVASAGLKVSRSKLAAMVRSGGVSVNYREITSPARTLKSGDVVSVRGVGKLEIVDCTTTSKGRFRVDMKRFI